ncbi:MAG: C-type lectin domain-containing protein [Synechococcaceae cyanobacterium]
MTLFLVNIVPGIAKARVNRVTSGIHREKLYEVYQSDQLIRWSDARDYAGSQLFAKLVSINDPTENRYISSLIVHPSLWVDSNSPPGNLIGPYIGLRQLSGSSEPEGGWRWENGTPMGTYSYWFFNQPDNYNDDNAGLFYNGYAGATIDSQWGDVLDSWTITTGPYAPGPNPFLANSFVVEYPFPESATVKVASGALNGILYEVYRHYRPFTYSQAQVYARDVLGVQLAVIHDAEQNAFLSSLISDASLWTDSGSPANNFIGPYIGLYQLPGSTEPSGGWYWEDGAQLDNGYMNWFSNQPDNYNGDNVGVFYNAFDKAVVDSKWGDVVNSWTISTGPYAPGPNPFLSKSFITQRPFNGLRSDVPGPLSILGSFAGCGWSRHLRDRCRTLRRNSASVVHSSSMTPE